MVPLDLVMEDIYKHLNTPKLKKNPSFVWLLTAAVIYIVEQKNVLKRSLEGHQQITPSIVTELHTWKETVPEKESNNGLQQVPVPNLYS